MEAVSTITLNPKNGDGATLLGTEFFLNLSDNLDSSKYLDEDGQPKKEGCHAIASCFIQGLVGNIHYAHQNGFRDSAEHLRYIIKELERGFSSVMTVEKSEFKPIKNIE